MWLQLLLKVHFRWQQHPAMAPRCCARCCETIHPSTGSIPFAQRRVGNLRCSPRCLNSRCKLSNSGPLQGANLIPNSVFDHLWLLRQIRDLDAAQLRNDCRLTRCSSNSDGRSGIRCKQLRQGWHDLVLHHKLEAGQLRALSQRTNACAALSQMKSAATCQHLGIGRCMVPGHEHSSARVSFCLAWLTAPRLAFSACGPFHGPSRRCSPPNGAPGILARIT